MDACSYQFSTVQKAAQEYQNYTIITSGAPAPNFRPRPLEKLGFGCFLTRQTFPFISLQKAD